MTTRAEKDALYAISLDHVTWAAADGTDPDNRFEMAQLADGAVALRHASDPHGTVLRYTAAEWQAFLDGAAANEFEEDLRTSNP
jgi:hypothetical protein